MPKPKLKLAFAMGGGVSLGCFSGAALTESIKLALLRIAEGDADYDRVEIDVFSGASAGSLSLAIMLRALTWRTKDEATAASQHLTKNYPGLEAACKDKPGLWENLVAAQVAQDLQNRAWVQSIDLDQLLGGGDRKRRESLRYAPGLLDSEAVYRIARALLLPPASGVLWDRCLLADRCLYASTLTSLTPFVVNAKTAFQSSDGSLPGLRDALESRMHKDMRIFDLLFTKKLTQAQANKLEALQKDLALAAEQQADASAQVVEHAVLHGMAAQPAHPAAIHPPSVKGPEFPPRWFRLHDGSSKEGVAWNYQEARSWATIAATAIASGAFPGAFAPAVLERFAWEYGWNSKDPLSELSQRSSWPQILKDSREEQHHFAYIDGGVFNNEPVREAFRLVSFADQREDEAFLRRVLYVDPSVGPENTPLQVPALVEFRTGKGGLFDLYSPEAGALRTSLPRIVDLIGNLVSVLVHQGRTREADSVLATRGGFKARDHFRTQVRELVKNLDPTLAQQLWVQLSAGCNLFLKQRAADLIPPGDGSAAGELKRILRELKLTHLTPSVDAYIQSGFANADFVAHQADWLWAHVSMYFDLTLGLEGKNEDALLIAITPYQQTAPNKALVPLKLLGAPISAFAGFMSRAARDFDFEAGRYAASLFLNLTTAPPRLDPANTQWRLTQRRSPSPALREQYERDLLRGILDLGTRVEDVLKNGLSRVLVGPALGLLNWKAKAEELVPKLVVERFENVVTDLDLDQGIEFILLCPDDISLELDAKGWLDRDAAEKQIYFGGTMKRCLATWSRFDKASETWLGGAVHAGTRLHIDRKGLRLGHWAIVGLPDKRQWEELLKKARPYLRPVAILDISLHKPSGRSKTIPAKHWEIHEAAVPLIDSLLHGPH